MDQGEEYELIRRAQQGDSDAWGELIKDLARLVESLARKFSPSLKDDLAQEGNIALYRSVLRFDPDQGVRLATYAYCRIYGVMNDYAQKMASRGKPLPGSEEDDELVLQLPDQGLTPEEETERRQLRKVLDQAIRELPEREKTVLILHHYEGLSVKEISERREMAGNTVKSHLFRARERLRKNPNLQAFAKDFGIGGEDND